MNDGLGAALQALKQQTGNAAMPTILSREVLEREFHGLDLSQLVKLTDAPVLATAAAVQTAEGGRVERFEVDGKEPGRRSALVRSLLLDEIVPPRQGGMREVIECDGGTASRTLLRDLGDTIYRIEDQQAVVEPELTEALRLNRRAQQAPPHLQALPTGEAPAVSDAVGEILQGLAAMHAANQLSFASLRALVEAAGVADLRQAVAALDPGSVAEALQRVATATERIEQLIVAVQGRAAGLLRRVAAPVPDARPEPEAAAATAWSSPGHL